MGRRKQCLLKNSQIQKEQIQLLKIQKELEGILGKVNEAINELKVEELQLKSSAVTAMNTERQQTIASTIVELELPSTSTAKASILSALSEPQSIVEASELEIDLVNQQKIDLDTLVRHNRGMEEEEDDDD